MVRNRQLPLLPLIVLMLLVVTVNSQLSQYYDTSNLYWGVSEGDKIYYDYYSQGMLFGGYPITFTTVVQERVYVQIDELQEIPGQIQNVGELMLYTYATYFENDTLASETGSEWFWFILLPLGNWSLYTESVLATAPPVGYYYEIIDDASLWGVTQGSSDESFIYNYTLTLSKTDGALYNLETRIRNTTNNEIINLIQVNRVVPFGFTIDYIWAGVVIIEVIIAVVIIQKYRGRSV